MALINRADNHEETIRLTNKFKNLKKERLPFYLTQQEFEEILKWKLRRQIGRQKAIRTFNSDLNIRKITETSFLIKHTDEDFETKLKLRILCCISGVQIPIASAILTLCFPDTFCVIDVRNWRELFKPEKEKRFFTENDYLSYKQKINDLSIQFSLTPQEIDIAIWVKGE